VGILTDWLDPHPGEPVPETTVRFRDRALSPTEVTRVDKAADDKRKRQAWWRPWDWE